jgi:hypothetical protein
MKHALEDAEFFTALGFTVHHVLRQQIANRLGYYPKDTPSRVVKSSNDYYRRKTQHSMRFDRKMPDPAERQRIPSTPDSEEISGAEEGHEDSANH